MSLNKIQLFNNPLSLFLGKRLRSSSHVFGQEFDERLISFFTPPDCRCYEVGPEVIEKPQMSAVKLQEIVFSHKAFGLNPSSANRSTGRS